MNSQVQWRGKLLEFPSRFWIARPEPYVPTWRDRIEGFVERRTGLVVAIAAAAGIITLTLAATLFTATWMLP